MGIGLVKDCISGNDESTVPPLCRGPDSIVNVPDFVLPDKSCDCHFHIFDEPSPQVFPRTYTAPVSPLKDLVNLHGALGITRSIVVQPSVYGTDNRTTLSAVTSTSATKAIAVVEDRVSFTELTELSEAGVVGCRVNLLFQSNAAPINLRALSRKISEVDWHLQILADVSTFPELEKTVRSLKVPVVFDHMGHMASQKSVKDPGFQQLLRLLGDGLAWVKLSGAYRVTDGYHPDYSDVDDIVDALVRTNPDRLVWGSDWPHPQIPHAMPNDTQLLNLLSKWVPDTTLRNRILVDNPEQLYGF